MSYTDCCTSALALCVLFGSIPATAVVQQSLSTSVTGTGQTQLEEALLRRAAASNSFTVTRAADLKKQSQPQVERTAIVVHAHSILQSSPGTGLHELDHGGKNSLDSLRSESSSKLSMSRATMKALSKLHNVMLASVGVTVFLILVSMIVKKLRAVPSSGDPEAEILRLEQEKSALTTQLDELDRQMAERSAAITARVEEEEAEAARAEAEVRRREQEEAAAQSRTQGGGNDNAAKQKMMQLYANPAALEEKRQKAQQLINGVVEEVQHSAEELGKDTAKHLQKEVMDVLEVELDPSEVNGFKANPKDCDSPPLSILVAAIFAPIQLTFSRGLNEMQVAFFFPQMVAFVIALIMDIHQTCDPRIFVWTYVIIILLTVVCGLRFRISRLVAALLKEVKENAEEFAEDQEEPPSENAILRLINTFQEGPRQFFRSLHGLDAVGRSKVNGILNYATVAIVLWGGFGVWLTIHDVVEDEESCKAGTLMTVMHVYTFLYLFFVTWTLLGGAVAAIVSAAANNEKISVGILIAASNFDEKNMPGGFPLAVVLVKGLVLRSEEDMRLLEVTTLKTDINELEEEQFKMKNKLDDLNEELAEKDRKLNTLKDDDGKIDIEEFIDRYTAIVTTVLDAACPLVGIAAVSMEKAENSMPTIEGISAARNAARTLGMNAAASASANASGAASSASSAAGSYVDGASSAAQSLAQQAPASATGLLPTIDEQASSSSTPFNN